MCGKGVVEGEERITESNVKSTSKENSNTSLSSLNNILTSR